jgi:hypothetical protein
MSGTTPELPPELFLEIIERYIQLWKSVIESNGCNQQLITQRWSIKRVVVLRSISWHYKETFDHFLFSRFLPPELLQEMKKKERKDREIEDIRTSILKNFEAS